MRIRIQPTARLPRRAAESRAPPHRNGRSCKWSSRRSSCAKGVFHPFPAVRAIGQAMHGEYIETQREVPPLLFALKKILRGQDDLAPLGAGDGGKRAAEFRASSLPDFDDGQYAAIQAHQINLTRLAAQIARQNF